MMPIRTCNDAALHRFHRSLYISLALAVGCLTYVEWWFLPEIVILGIVVLGVMIVAYRAECRWSLSLRAANMVGVAIAIMLLAWAAYHYFRPQGTLLGDLHLQAVMLVYLGPLVIILIPAKLFRPKNHGDYWSMQLIGLVTVGLACALGGNSGLGIFVLAYAASAVWCLTNFHAVANGRGNDQHVSADTRYVHISRIGVWTIAAMMIAVGLSLATPRNSDGQWGVGGLAHRATIGNSDDRLQIDLNFTGDLETTNEVAFVVHAETADRQPKLDLSQSQKWRGGSFNFYDQGKWVNRGWPRLMTDGFPGDRRLPRGRAMYSPPQNNQGISGHPLPDLGSKQYFIVFPYPALPRGTFYLANPIWPPSTRTNNHWLAPVITETRDGIRNWLALRDGEVFPPLSIRGDLENITYRQVTAPTPEPGLSLPVVIDPGQFEMLKVLIGLKPLREFSDRLLQQLAAGNQLPNLKNWTPASGRPPIERQEEIARAIEKHFSTSGQFEYNTQSLKRVDMTIDPIEDFLLNVRQGHCSRFATAMTLILRAQGIPARIVLGYEGCESNGDGTYTVRQMHAHSWVECLVRRGTTEDNYTWHWLTLDPSPSIERVAAPENHFSKWLEGITINLSEFFRTFVMELNAERQDRARSAMAFLSPLEWGPGLIQFLKTPAGWAMAGVVVISTWFWHRRRSMPDLSVTSIYHQLRTILQKSHFINDSTGGTPRELFRVVEKRVDDREVVQAVRAIVDQHGEATYGGQPIGSADLAQLRADLQTVSNYCRVYRGQKPTIPMESRT